MAPKRQKKTKHPNNKKHRSRFAKRSKIEIAPIKEALLEEQPEIEIEKTAPAQQPIAPAPPLKKEAEIVLDQKQAVTTKNELKKKATTQDSTVILLFQDEDKKFLASPQIISGKRHEPIKF